MEKVRDCQIWNDKFYNDVVRKHGHLAKKVQATDPEPVRPKKRGCPPKSKADQQVLSLNHHRCAILQTRPQALLAPQRG